MYLLWNPSAQRTYIGVTTDVTRRLRQHNKEIKGGAKSTSKYSGWIIHCTLEGLKNRSEAQRWEKIVKGRVRGLVAREQAFRDLSKGLCPSGRIYPVPSQLIFRSYE